MTSAPEVSASARQIVDTLMADLDRLSLLLARRIRSTLPSYAGPEGISEADLQVLASQHMRRGMLANLGELSLDQRGSDEARELGRLRARQGLPLEDILTAYRLGAQLMWEEGVKVSLASGVHAMDDVIVMANWLWEQNATLSDAVIDGYRAEEAHLLRVDSRRQQAFIDGLLDGRATDGEFIGEAARTLNLPRDARLVCIVALPAEDGSSCLPPAGFSVPQVQAVWGVRAGADIGLVSASPRDVDRMLDGLRTVARGRIGVSPPAQGLLAVPVSYRLAELAARTTVDGQVVRLEEHLPEALLASSDVVAPLIRERTVAVFDDLSDAKRGSLLATLEAMSACDWSPTKASALLHVHVNTVLYRMTRIETLFGRRLDQPADKLLWSLALLGERTPKVGTSA